MGRTAVQKQTVNRVNLRLLIMQAVQEILSDPDFGFLLTERAKRRLRGAAAHRAGAVYCPTSHKRERTRYLAGQFV